MNREQFCETSYSKVKLQVPLVNISYMQYHAKTLLYGDS